MNIIGNILMVIRNKKPFGSAIWRTNLHLASGDWFLETYSDVDSLTGSIKPKGISVEKGAVIV